MQSGRWEKVFPFYSFRRVMYEYSDVYTRVLGLGKQRQTSHDSRIVVLSVSSAYDWGQLYFYGISHQRQARLSQFLHRRRHADRFAFIDLKYLVIASLCSFHCSVSGGGYKT